MCPVPTDARKPGRPRDPELEARRRTEILDVAVKFFAEAGYADTNVDLIADKLKIGKGTIYRYFPTKRELFLATVDRGLKELAQTLDAILLAASDDPLGLVRSAIRAYLEFFHDRPEMAELFVQERAAFRDRHTPLYFTTGYEKQERDEQFVKALIAAGKLREMNPEHILMVTGDLLYGTIMSNHLSGRPSSPESQSDAILDVLLNGILSDSERKTQQRRRKT